MSSALPFPALALDTASNRVRVALLAEAGDMAFRESQEEASLSLYPLIASVLSEKALKLADLKAIVFCEGPGSMLGIRTAVMGIRSWVGAQLIGKIPLYSYTSLQLGASLVQLNKEPTDPFLVVTDARRKSWNCLRVDGSGNESVQLLENESLEHAPEPIYSFDEFPTWTSTKAAMERLPYRPELIFKEPEFTKLLRPNPKAEPMSSRTLEFVKWVPQARTSDQISP